MRTFTSLVGDDLERLLEPAKRSDGETFVVEEGHLASSVEQDHPRTGGVDVAECPFEGVVGQFGDLAGYITQSPPEKQECFWTKSPHDAPYEGNEPLELTPGPTC